MDYKLKKLPKNTVEILVDLSRKEVSVQYESAFEKLRQSLEIEGFRRGKVPADIASKHLKKEAIFSQLLNDYLPRIYDQILRKEDLKPIISPKIELLKAKEDEDWQLRISVAQKPKIELRDYKKKLKAIKGERKKDDIWVPGKDKGKEVEQESEARKQGHLNEVLTAILSEVSCEIPDLLVEDEISSRLTKLVDEVQKMGLTVESYLKSKNLTHEQLREQFRREIEDSYKLEFILLEIADQEKIQVEKEEVEKLFANITEPAQKKQAEQNAYMYASILRKQKTLDFLTNL